MLKPKQNVKGSTDLDDFDFEDEDDEYTTELKAAMQAQGDEQED